MDAAVRYLRDGGLPDSADAAMCCVLDNLGVIGGQLMMQQVARSFAAAMWQKRSQATCIRLVAVTEDYRGIVQALAAAEESAQQVSRPGKDLEVIDIHSDPWGWCQPDAQSGSSTSSIQTVAFSGSTPSSSLRPATSLEELRAALVRPPSAAPHQPDRVAAASLPSPQQGSPGISPSQPHSKSQQKPQSEGAGPGGVARSVCLVIDCLSSLMERYGEWQVLSLLESVQRAPAVSCIITSAHTDLHSERVMFAIQRLAGCTLELGPLSPLQVELAQQADAEGRAPAGRLDCRTKRRTGRVKVESELYALVRPREVAGAAGRGGRGGAASGGPLALLPLPPLLDAPDPKALVRVKQQLQQQQEQQRQQQEQQQAGTAAATAGGGAAAGTGAGAGQAASDGVPAARPGAPAGGPVGHLGGVATPEELARAVGSSMRLTLTEEERRAKEAVVLPYQHTGIRGSAAYEAGDHRAYLPPAAGGHGPAAGGSGQQRLGHILYVRDSEGEVDSDQDMDEDLDV